MGPFEMVVAIVAIVMIASVVRGRRARADAAPPPGLNADAQRMAAEVARLKERVEVLERLATDKSRRLSDEIDSLRS